MPRTSSRSAASATPLDTEFTGREPLGFALLLTPEKRKGWLAARLEAYRDATVHYAATVVRERVEKVTVAEAEARAVIATEGLTKVVPLEASLYPFLLGGDVISQEELNLNG